jgi:hypothetical protein
MTLNACHGRLWLAANGMATVTPLARRLLCITYRGGVKASVPGTDAACLYIGERRGMMSDVTALGQRTTARGLP